MKIEILGNGGAFSKTSTSYLVNDNIMVDCGEATIKTLITDFASPVLDKIEHLFITHTHSDHINGLEQFLYYRLIKNMFKGIDNLTIYGTPEVLEHYKNLAFSKDPLNNGVYIQPFKFVVLPWKGTSSNIIDDKLHITSIKADHMNKTLPGVSLVVVDRYDLGKKFIITGDMDTINQTIYPDLIKKDTYLFHDMGWTGLPDVDNKYKFHPTEKEVFDYYGENSNIFGIHTDTELVHYKKAEIGLTIEV